MISETHNEDCMVTMARFPDKFFDLAVVDPPYGIGSWWKKSVNTKNYCDKEWNNEKPGKEYFEELFRVSKNQIIWGGNYFTEFIAPTNSWIIWDKLMNNNPTSDCELAWTSFKTKMRIVRVLWSGALKDEKDFQRIHPCQRPVKLITEVLKKYANPGDKILDTHMGSQSSRIAAYDMGFDYWGAELDPDYFRMGNERYQKHIAQLKLEFS